MAIQNNVFQNLINLVPKPFRNRYVLVLLVFFIWMAVFDTANVRTQYKLNQSVEKLKKDKKYYEEQIKQAELEKKDIDGNLEKFAREKYYLKKKNEDVFIIVDESED